MKFDNRIAKTLGLRENTDVPLSPNAMIMNEIDRDIYHDCVDRYEAMSENLEAGLKEYAPFDYLSEDIFNSLFKYNAKLHEEEDMRAFSKFNHKLMGEMMESEEYEKLRKSTKFDLMGSAIGTEVMQQSAMEKIMHFKEQLQKQRQTGQPMDGADAGELIEQMNQAKGTQNAIDDLIGSVPGGVQGMTPQQASQLAALQHQLQQEEELIEDNIKGQQQLQEGMDEAMEQGSKKANDMVTEVRDIVSAWGLESGQSNRRISLDKRRKSIERVRRSSRLKELTDLIGRFKTLALKEKKQKVKDGHSIKSVTVGDKLESLIPSEWAQLAHPTLKKNFMKRFNEKQLLQYQKEDTRSKGRGPCVFCHDKSWSMEDDSKDDWATALGLATLEVAQKERRDFAYVPYNGGVMTDKVKDIRHGELDPDDIMDIAELSPYGGTDFEAPLRKALEFLESSSYKKGDILFVTDGECGVREEFLKEFNQKKLEKKFFVHTVLINIGGGASDGTVKLFSDHITTISSVADLDEAKAADIFKISASVEENLEAAEEAGLLPSDDTEDVV